LLYQKRPDISIEEVRRIREQEAFASVQAIGAEGRMLGFGDNPLHMTAARIEQLAAEIAAFKPDFVLTHWKEERNYASHWITAQSVIQAAQIAHVPWDRGKRERGVKIPCRRPFRTSYA
jgi:LmbE family N-acetylglucosaminyl deacetylase